MTLEEVESFRVLGVIISNSLKWEENTDFICNKARKKIWLIRNMKLSGLSEYELVDAYKKEIRSLLELAVPVWHSGLTVVQSNKIERIQKLAAAAILGTNYTSYKEALSTLKLKTLAERRTQICLKFIQKNMKSESPLLAKVHKIYKTRSDAQKAAEFQCRTKAFFDSSLPFLARLYNQYKKFNDL